MDGRDRATPQEASCRGGDEGLGVREFDKEGIPIDLDKLLAGKGPRPFLPKRWIVERTFCWLSQNRRMSKDYERLPESSEAFIYVAMSRLMARRLARS
jgi:hypothetical protein